MPRRLLVLNAVLAILCMVFAVGIARTLLVKHPVPGPAPAAQRAAAASQPTATTEAGNPGWDAFAVIVAQNLFNPGRSETAAAAAVSVAKPILHGVVIDGAKSRAYLEDPTAKRVAGYSVGDTMGGGKIQKIADDRVVIARPEGMIEVLLQDPSKPRPAPPATAVPAGPAAPGQLAPSQVAPGQAVSPVPAPPATQPPSTVPQFRGRPAPQG
jgi:type II secretory pathway component PulC